ncbi:MAG TPA: IS1 family transposase [Stellaceae bacterium]|nr:IS1 family transposase [Stellaceae bacterium]
MNRLTTEQRAQILGLMVEGMAIRAISRMTGASKNTIAKLLIDAGRACSDFQDRALRELPCKVLQLDEIWSFVGAKEKNVPAERKGLGIGDVWTWTAICSDTKLIPSWFVGNRDIEHASAFVLDLKGRLGNRVQITSDGHKPYLKAVPAAFGDDVDYAMLVKIYGHPTNSPEAHRRYSPTPCLGAKRQAMIGNPDMSKVSTSHAERMNLNIRMGLRRFTRLTNAFSKKMENHTHALSIYFMFYNFVRIHQTLRVTPAMAAGVTDKLWSLTDMVRIVDEYEQGQLAAPTREFGGLTSYTRRLEHVNRRGKTGK